jgi:hypothetical protein
MPSACRASSYACLHGKCRIAESSPAVTHDGLDLSQTSANFGDAKYTGHHESNCEAVLGAAQGSPLRFDRAARGVGLDSASAQPVLCTYVMAGKERHGTRDGFDAYSTIDAPVDRRYSVFISPVLLHLLCVRNI